MSVPIGPCNPGLVTIHPSPQHLRVVVAVHLGRHAKSHNVCFHKVLVVRQQLVLTMKIVLHLWRIRLFALIKMF